MSGISMQRVWDRSWRELVAVRGGYRGRCGGSCCRRCRRHVAKVTPGIYRRVVDPDFVVQVRAGRAAAVTFVADHVARLDVHAALNIEARKMAVPGSHAKAMVNDDQPAVACVLIHFLNHPVGSRADFISVVRGDVEPGVEGTLTA